MAGPILFRFLWSSTRNSSPSFTPSPFFPKLNFFSRAASPAATSASQDPSHRRNVPIIIAHVDHGKTALMDRLLHQCGITTASKDILAAVNPDPQGKTDCIHLPSLDPSRSLKVWIAAYSSFEQSRSTFSY